MHLCRVIESEPQVHTSHFGVETDDTRYCMIPCCKMMTCYGLCYMRYDRQLSFIAKCFSAKQTFNLVSEELASAIHNNKLGTRNQVGSTHDMDYSGLGTGVPYVQWRIKLEDG